MFVLSALLSPAFAAPQPAATSPDEAVYAAIQGLTLTPQLKTTSTGKGKKRLVSFAPKAGSVQAYDMITSQKIAMTMVGPEGERIELPGLDALTPTITASMRNTVGEPTDNGLFPVEVDYLDTKVSGVPAELQSQLESTMGSMIGFRMLVDGTSGRIVQVDADSSDQAMFEMMQSVVDSAITNMPAFPVEPIGPGATWTIDFDMDMGGMNLLAHQNVELKALDGTKAELAYTFTMERGEGDLAIPGLPPGANAEFTSFSGSGAGTQTVDLANLTNVGTSSFDVTVDMKIAAEGRPAMEMGMKMKQSVETRLAK